MSESTAGVASLEALLASTLLATHPSRAALALERLGVDATLEFQAEASIAELVAVVPLLSPQLAGDAMKTLPVELLAGMLAALTLDEAARLARLAPERVEALLERLAPAEAEALRAILAYPPQTAGSLMDPRVLALPEDLTAAEALDRCRERPRLVRYNLYVLDAEGRLTGVLNLNELLVARATARLSELMVREPLSIQASAGRANIAAHPGWRRVHSLPVVDERGRYLGAIRYRTWRRIEDGLRRHDESETTRALGELLSVGAGGLVRSLTRSGPADEE